MTVKKVGTGYGETGEAESGCSFVSRKVREMINYILWSVHVCVFAVKVIYCWSGTPFTTVKMVIMETCTSLLVTHKRPIHIRGSKMPKLLERRTNIVGSER